MCTKLETGCTELGTGCTELGTGCTELGTKYMLLSAKMALNKHDLELAIVCTGLGQHVRNQGQCVLS